MFLITRPNRQTIVQFLEKQQGAPFSYPQVGASQTAPPRGYTVDHNRIRLGTGQAAFERARCALQRWTMFETRWTQLCWPDTPIAVGSTVCTLAHHLGFWSLNACRIIYVVEDGRLSNDSIARYGFAFGTLLDHAEQGEERFLVEYHRDDDSVWFDQYAFSRPRRPLAKIGRPFVRSLQKQFARDAQQAMLNAVQSSMESRTQFSS